jgi:hypothetical protein
MVRDTAFPELSFLVSFSDPDFTSPPQAQKLFRQAVDAIHTGDMKQAAAFLETASTTYNDLASIYLLGRIHCDDQYDFCNPLYGTALLLRCANRGYSKAQDALQAAFPKYGGVVDRPKPEPEKPTAAQEDLYLLAQAFEKSGNPELAKYLYHQLENCHGSANLQLGHLALKDNPSRAVLHLGKASSLGAQAARAFLTVVFTEFLSKRPELSRNMTDILKDYVVDIPQMQLLISNIYLDSEFGPVRYDKGIYHLYEAMDSDEHIGFSEMAAIYESDWLDPSGDRKMYIYWLESGASHRNETCITLLLKLYTSSPKHFDINKVCRWAKKLYECTSDPEKKLLMAQTLAEYSDKAEDRLKWAMICDKLQR